MANHHYRTLGKVQIEQQWSIQDKPEVPVPTIIPPRPSASPCGSPGKVCYCVERSAEQQVCLFDFYCIFEETKEHFRETFKITCRPRLAEHSCKQPGGFALGHPFSRWGSNTSWLNWDETAGKKGFQWNMGITFSHPTMHNWKPLERD